MLVLPAAPVRNRYRRELEAELAQLPPRRQLGFALRVLTRAFALRRAVVDDTATKIVTEVALQAPARPLLCRLNLRHKWKRHSTEDGQRYLRCVRCDKDDAALRTQPGVMIIGVDWQQF
jgi:hypothetical protein